MPRVPLESLGAHVPQEEVVPEAPVVQVSGLVEPFLGGKVVADESVAADLYVLLHVHAHR